jgi:hypothetical protein
MVMYSCESSPSLASLTHHVPAHFLHRKQAFPSPCAAPRLLFQSAFAYIFYVCVCVCVRLVRLCVYQWKEVDMYCLSAYEDI